MNPYYAQNNILTLPLAYKALNGHPPASLSDFIPYLSLLGSDFYRQWSIFASS